MAASAEPEGHRRSGDEHDSTNEQRQYHGDHQYATSEGGEQYREETSTLLMPTKDGDEHEMQVDSDRPGTAGTDHSAPLPEDDERVLASTAPTQTQSVEFGNGFAGATLFMREDRPSDNDISAGFIFGQRSDTQQPGHVMPTRQVPTASIFAKPEEPDSQETHSYSKPGDTKPESYYQDPVHQDFSQLHDSAAETTAETQPSDVAEATGTGQSNVMQGHNAGSKRGKTRKRKRTCSATDNQIIETAAKAPSSVMKEPETFGVPLAQVDPAIEHGEDVLEALPAANEVEARAATPINQTQRPVDVQQEHPSSPHSQLQEDLDNATQHNGFVQQHLGPVADAVAEQPDPVYTAETEDQTSPLTEVTPVEQAMPLVQDEAAAAAKPPKSKNRSKGERRASVLEQPLVTNKDISTYSEILSYKIRLQGLQRIEGLKAERDAALQNLQEREDALHNLQAGLYQVQQDKHDLTYTCDQQQTKLVTYEAKFKRFKVFTDGLGKDVDSLKRDANATRNKSEQLLREGEDRAADREQLLEQMNKCSERSIRLRDDALKACSQVQSELQTATQRADYLHQQLDEKVGLLTEERDRRSQLERRLLSASEPSESIVQAIKANHDAVLDKLHIMHASLEESESKSRISNVLKETLDAVQAAASSTTSTADDTALTKVLVEDLSDRLSNIEGNTSMDTMKQQLDQVLAELKGVADNNEDRTRQDAAHSEAMQELRQKLTDSNLRVSNAEQKLQLAQHHRQTFESENQQLKDRLATTQAQNGPPGEMQAQLEGIRVELRAKNEAVETANSSLARKTAELETLKNANSELEVTMNGLREKIKDLEQTRADLLPAKQAVEDRIRLEIEHVRTESLRHSEEYRAQLNMESKNQLKKVTSERDRYEKQLTPLKAELAVVKKHAEALQKKLDDSAALSEQLDSAKKLAQSQTKEIDGLKSSLHEHQQVKNADTSPKEKISALSADLDNVKAKLQEAAKENATLHKKANAYLQDSEEAAKSCEQTKKELVTHRADTEARLTQLNEALKDAQEAQRRAEAGEEHLRKSCEAAIEKEVAKARRQAEDLQRRLTEADAELAKEKVNGENFRVDMENEWQLETDDHAQKLNDLRTQVDRAEEAKDDAQASIQRLTDESKALLEQVNTLQQGLTSAEEKIKQHQNATEHTLEASSRLTVPSLSEGITPSASVNSIEPIRPRKKVDRSCYTAFDASALPAPEVLRPGSHRSVPSQGDLATDEPFIEDSQAVDTQVIMVNTCTDSGVRNFEMFSDTNDMEASSRSLQSQLGTQVVEETQTDSLPSFAAFHRHLSATQVDPSNHLSSTLSQTYEQVPKATVHASSQGGQGLQATNVSQPRVSHATQRLDAGFSIYDDGHDTENQPPDAMHTTSADHLRESLNLSHEDRERYTFHKKMPQPNSASKLVHINSQSPGFDPHRVSSLQERAPLRERKFETPELRGESAHSSQLSTAHSSSPAYVQPTNSRPRRTYSNTPMDRAKRESSRTQNMSSQDPRLLGRSQQASPKRKAENSIVEGYEQERKKRVGLSSAGVPTSGTQRFNLRSQQSINDLPSFPTMPANPKGSSSQSRVRTLGGASSRTTGSKKLSKGDEYDMRFSQELRRR